MRHNRCSVQTHLYLVWMSLQQVSAEKMGSKTQRKFQEMIQPLCLTIYQNINEMQQFSLFLWHYILFSFIWWSITHIHLSLKRVIILQNLITFLSFPWYFKKCDIWEVCTYTHVKTRRQSEIHLQINHARIFLC